MQNAERNIKIIGNYERERNRLTKELMKVNRKQDQTHREKEGFAIKLKRISFVYQFADRSEEKVAGRMRA